MEAFGFVNENYLCDNIIKDKTKINTIYGEIKKEVTDYLNSINNTVEITNENKIIISNESSNHFIIESDELPKGLTLSSLD